MDPCQKPLALWGDDWFRGDLNGSVPHATLRKIERRALLYQERKKALVGLDHLKKDERDQLKTLLGGVRVSYMNEATADTLAAALHEEYPWLSAATDRAWLQMRRAAHDGRPVRVGPLLLNGPPGIGKSAWSRALARALKSPHLTIDAAASGAGFAVAGTERGWSSAQPGRPIQAIMQHRHAGPVIIVDEVCKAAIGHSAKGHYPTSALLHKSSGDSCCESSVVAGLHEKTHTSDLQDDELGCL